MTTGRELVNKDTGEIIQVSGSHNQPMPLVITPQYVATTQQSLTLLRELTKGVLKKDRDYGHVWGIAGEFLFDPGAQLIISAFNCHTGHRRILHLTDNEEKIAILLEVPIISNNTGMEVGCGVGASSTMEVKHKYRWIRKEEFEYYGIDEESAKSLKKRTEDAITEYRINNPEHSELLNTLIKIASKRAEVDAAESLPGVSSALKELFDFKARKAAQGAGAGESPKAGQSKSGGPDWNTFWAKTKQMGLEPRQVHEMIGVKTMNDWLKQNKTLDEAITVLSQQLASAGAHNTQAAAPPEDSGNFPTASYPPLEEELPEEDFDSQSKPEYGPYKTDPSNIKSFDELWPALKKDFGLNKVQALKEAGYNSEKDITEKPSDIYIAIASVR